MADWKFYGRRKELDALRRLLTADRWFFCAISGRRRIGKTSLIRQAIQSLTVEDRLASSIYLQVPDSDERDVVAVFADALRSLGTALPAEIVPDNMRRFADMAKAIGILCREGHYVILDEFQYFTRKSLAAFPSLLQAEVDSLVGSRHGGIFVLGSIHTEMTALLENRTSPLHARVTDRLALDHWDFATLFQVFDDQSIASPHDWLTLWAMFEGVPKFYRDCAVQGVFDQPAEEPIGERAIDRLFLSGSAPLAEEAGTWFLRELRGTNVSILRLLATLQPCVHQQLTSAYEQSIGDAKSLATYLGTLIERYRLIERQHPVFGAAGNRLARYRIADNFLAAWLAAIEPAVQAARVQPTAKALAIGALRLENHEGFVFERMIRSLLEECSRNERGDFALTQQVTGYWNRPREVDRMIEIDIIAINDNDRHIRFGSCKRGDSKHNAESLDKNERHIQDFLATSKGRPYRGWQQERALYSPFFNADRRASLEGRGYRCYDLNNFSAWLGAGAA